MRMSDPYLSKTGRVSINREFLCILYYTVDGMNALGGGGVSPTNGQAALHGGGIMNSMSTDKTSLENVLGTAGQTCTRFCTSTCQTLHGKRDSVR